MTAQSLSSVVLAFAIPLLVFETGCKSETPGGSVASGGKQGPAQKVLFVRAKEEEIVDRIEVIGRTSANERVEIQSRVSGFLQKIHFVDGQLVKEGDVLFTIDPEEYDAVLLQSEAQIEVAQSKLNVAEKTFARSQKLMQESAISREDFDQSQAAVEEAQARVIVEKANAARVELDVKYTEVTSPISGRVDRALLDEGNYVIGGTSGGTVLTTVVNDQPIKAVANVDENVRLRFMRQLHEVSGQPFQRADKLTELEIPCELQLSDESGFPHKGILEYGEIVVDEATGTSRVRASFDNDNYLLTPGMFVRLRIPIAQPHRAVVVPNIAIGTDQATQFVYVINDQDEIEQRTVSLGKRQGEKRVVRSGVSDNESVVVGGLQFVRPGMKVDPVLKTD
ncbi:efflux RND transporter periplasmic adaptor subunit [Allorhodopirellula solitaria]|uniref:Toluene efflux pump periplasmic linker protein TtgD n=1 Tax=Allorhodopirellula solitaria TaxID=2527987 RepID=A0A5C5YKB2_9BACT|nr:efflux RND transporter periplasmic adaptor subunit [Allorhodopirellula solitaria]TWT75304.1 Toluene efflux pump periplasmic linker protein TtgD precursor [Allorhodopirellula solitaria]